jgi:HEAT repeats
MMNKEKFIQLAYLYILDELDEKDKTEFENQLMQDDDLKNEFENISNNLTALKMNKPSMISQDVLIESRHSLMREIRKESVNPSFITKLKITIRNYYFSNYKLAFGGIVTFAFGIVIGYILLISKSNKPTPSLTDNISHETEKISNVQITKPASNDSLAEVHFDAIKQVKFKAKLSDPIVQKLLLSSLMNDPNPGDRIRSVNSISIQEKNNNFKSDPKIEQVLITALTHDKNPAVRREALNVLIKYPYDLEIRDALLIVLSRDRNSGMRVAAINAFADLKQSGETLDEETKNVLNTKKKTDNNDFIKIRAASILQEVN